MNIDILRTKAKEECPLKEEGHTRNVWIMGYMTGYIERDTDELKKLNTKSNE